MTKCNHNWTIAPARRNGDVIICSLCGVTPISLLREAAHWLQDYREDQLASQGFELTESNGDSLARQIEAMLPEVDRDND